MSCERAGKPLPLKEYREALALVPHAQDPMVISHAYATGIYAHARRGAYSEAISLAEAAVKYCSSLRLSFPLVYCLAYRAHAEIGARRLKAARSSLDEIAPDLRLIEDTHLQVVYETLKAKLAIAADHASYASVCSSLQFTDADVPDWPLADLIAVEATVLAAQGRQADVHARLERIMPLTRGPTADLLLAFTDLISRIEEGAERCALGTDFTELVRRTARLQCLDVLVTAYRACPKLLQIVLEDRSVQNSVRAQISRSRDSRLADGTALASEHPAVQALTPREAEVASLLAAGLTNAQIATTLFIAHSTAKVHVHRVMRKLQAATRLEAALAWRDAQAPAKPR